MAKIREHQRASMEKARERMVAGETVTLPEGYGKAQATLEHREAFIQDLAAMDWTVNLGGGPGAGYVAIVRLGKCVYFYYVALPRSSGPVVVTTKDPTLTFDLTVDEAKRIVGKVWREA